MYVEHCRHHQRMAVAVRVRDFSQLRPLLVAALERAQPSNPWQSAQLRRLVACNLWPQLRAEEKAFRAVTVAGCKMEEFRASPAYVSRRDGTVVLQLLGRIPPHAPACQALTETWRNVH